MTSETDATVTIVVPTYKRPGMLADCLRSIAAQTYEQFVVFVCDNSPEQEARTVVEAFEDRRFTYHPRERNLGIFANAIGGFRAARTAFVMEVDDDDMLHANALASLVQPLLDDSEVTVAFGDLDVLDSSGRVLTGPERGFFIPDRPGLIEGRQEPFLRLAARGHIFLMSALIRRSAVNFESVPDKVGTAYDRFLTLAAARGGAAAYYVDRPLTQYRVHADADGYRNSAAQFAGALVSLKLEGSRATGEDINVFEAEIARLRLMRCRASLHQGEFLLLARDIRGLLAPRAVVATARLITNDVIPRRILGLRAALGWKGNRDRLVGTSIGVGPGSGAG